MLILKKLVPYAVIVGLLSLGIYCYTVNPQNAVSSGSMLLLRIALILRPSEVDWAPEYYDTPLCIAAKKGDDGAEMARVLLEHGADPNKAGALKQTPLFSACYGSHIEMVKVLLEAGADPNARDYDEQTPVHWVGSSGPVGRDAEVIALLLEHGAEVNVRSKSGTTPICSVRTKKSAELLVESGAELKVVDNEGRSPLHSIALHGDRELIEYIVGKGQDPKLKDNHGCLPLHYAAEFWNDEGVTYLAEVSDVNAKDENGDTPLHHAREGRMVNCLVPLGAEVNARNLEGRTPLDLAEGGRKDQFLIMTLLKHGAKHGADFPAEKTETPPEPKRKPLPQPRGF